MADKTILQTGTTLCQYTHYILLVYCCRLSLLYTKSAMW